MYKNVQKTVLSSKKELFFNVIFSIFYELCKGLLLRLQLHRLLLIP